MSLPLGKTLGTSDWVEITQDMVNLFAEATGDHQWIHVDVERATKESPFGGPIAHGYLTLSLVPRLMPEIVEFSGFPMTVNYGCEKVRFPSPVPVGSRLRATASVQQVTDDQRRSPAGRRDGDDRRGRREAGVRCHHRDPQVHLTFSVAPRARSNGCVRTRPLRLGRSRHVSISPG